MFKPHFARAVIAFAFFASLTASAIAADSKDEQITRGRALYFQHCIICHQAAGQGVPGTFPPLANSDYLQADTARAIRAVAEGLSGAIVVNGKPFNGVMPPVVLDDAKAADVLTFVLNAFNNGGGQTRIEDFR